MVARATLPTVAASALSCPAISFSGTFNKYFAAQTYRLSKRLCCKYEERAAREGRRSPQGQCLLGDAEDAVDELTLTDRIALSDPADLAFADGMHCLVALERSACALR